MTIKIIDKNYGSIPHLSTSKLNQQADKKISEGQEKILTEKVRDWRDLIIVTEKIDGSNVGVVNIGGELHAITRAGYDAATSEYAQHHYFKKWMFVNKSKFNWLPDKWRVCGEWCVQAHGTLYDITFESPFVAFDIIDKNNNRICYIDFIKLCNSYLIPTVPLLHIGHPINIKNAINIMGLGHYGRPEKPEGLVYRVERNGKVEFLAKWVRGYKEDGKYLDVETWNIGFDIKQYE